jgi:ABC-2 type transport system ATP-binding protein
LTFEVYLIRAVDTIEISELRKTYKAGIRALDGLTFGVEAGTIFGLLGPNGAGKSTAVRILTTLSRADSGEARVAGLDVVRDVQQVRGSIGVVGQKPGLDPHATGKENLEMQAELYGLTGGTRRARVNELLERLGLAQAAGRLAKRYSGGMQRRLDVALGLVHRPMVLFLDEPTTGLDPEARADLWRRDRAPGQRRGDHDPRQDATSTRPTGWQPGSPSSTAAASSPREARTS